MLNNISHNLIFVIDWGKYVPSIIAAFGGTGFLAGVILLIKARPEIGQIVVTSSEKALIVQTGVLENLNRELIRVNTENSKLREALNKQSQDMEQLRQQLKQLEAKLRQLTENTVSLTERTTAIENK